MADFIEINADLHLHGLYSGAVSDRMIPGIIGEQAPLKGIRLVGTGDILNTRWSKLVEEQLKRDGDVFVHENGTKFILQAEVEDSNRVHHIIFFPDMSKVQEMREALKSKCKDLDTDGRPKLWMNGEELAELCASAGCMIGFAHAFTPYFGLLAKYNSYKECYGSRWKDVKFMELGLSADTDMADRISELHELTFLSNSDAHSPWPNKLGREFNRLKLKEVSFEELAMALKREAGRCCALNVGFNPLEGKYHKTRCRGCLLFFRPEDAEKYGWVCPQCRSAIKKGVDWRVKELADVAEGVHPGHRPKYLHIIPLSEIISLAVGISNPYSPRVQEIWNAFVNNSRSEIDVLLDAEMPELKKIDAKIAEYIGYFRAEKIRYLPGGAGEYGRLLKPGDDAKINYFTSRQKGLNDFA